MGPILHSIQTPYVDAQTLLTLLSEYRKPREWILRMVKKGHLIRLKNGFYLIEDKIKRELHSWIPYEQIANLLYGPSYVSLEWALSFYGMIPERVYSLTSMTLGSHKEYNTPIGTFTYDNLSLKRYSIGITQKPSMHSIGNFLIATPEKALVDWIFKTCKGFNKTMLKTDILESKRMNVDSIRQLDKNLLMEIAESYRAKIVDELVNVIGIL